MRIFILKTTGEASFDLVETAVSRMFEFVSALIFLKRRRLFILRMIRWQLNVKAASYCMHQMLNEQCHALIISTTCQRAVEYNS